MTSQRFGITKGLIVVFLILLYGVLSLAHGQQTIFNVPTTDVLEKGKVYVELDASLKPTDGTLVPKFSSFVPRVVVGAGSRVEIGLNITGNIQPGPDSTTLVPTIKWKPYQGKDNGWAFVVGDNVFVPVRNRSYNAGNYVYAEASKTFKSGTRITFGGYDFTRNVVASANRAGGQFGFEQPLNKKVTFAADWFTGKHASGYFTPGVVFKIGPKVTGYAGYSIGNQNFSNGNHFFLLELGYNFIGPIRHSVFWEITYGGKAKCHQPESSRLKTSTATNYRSRRDGRLLNGRRAIERELRAVSCLR